MKKFYTYILRCNDNSYYVGSTRNIEVRFWEHQRGIAADYTAKRRPVQLVYVELYDRIDDAFYREYQVKKWSRVKKESLITQNYESLHYLAKKKWKFLD